LKLHAWNDIEFPVPTDWEMSAEGGNVKNGFIRFEKDQVSFELKWEPLKKPILAENIVDDFVKKLRSKQKDIKVHIKDELFISRHACSYFYFRSSKAHGYALSWSCTQSDRVFLGYISFPKTGFDQAKMLMKTSLPSLVCHCSNDLRNWSFYGMSFKAPTSYELSERKFVIGKITLTLASMKMIHSVITDISGIRLGCWSVANVKFKDDYADPYRWLDSNYRSEASKPFGNIKILDSIEGQIGHHQATIFTLQAKRGLRYRWSANLRTYVWYCEASNRMFALSFFRRVGKPSVLPVRIENSLPRRLIEQTTASFSCH
jgi:hypothetical protein